MSRGTGPPPPPEPGLCGGCAHARRQPTARGTSFLRCLRADADPRYLRYPPLPVRTCGGFETEADAETVAPPPGRRTR